MSEEKVYQELIEWLQTSEIVFSLTESKWVVPMISSYITPDEAQFLTGIPFSNQSLEELADLKGMDTDELNQKLEQLCAKGIMYASISGDSVAYRLNEAWEIFFRVPFWGGATEEPLKTMASYTNKYFYDGWIDQIKNFDQELMRSIPINETIEGEKQVLPFEDIIRYVDNFSYHTVSHCPCRERHRLDPDYRDSPYPSEVCLHFDELGRYIVEYGLGREITKEETLEILKKAADAGLVHQVANFQEKHPMICNCDSRYCMFFSKHHIMGHKRASAGSEYQVKVSPGKCKACTLCIKRCPMDAIQLKLCAEATNKFGKAVEVDRDKCMGCGVCVHKCPTRAITLERREEEIRTPKDGLEFYEQVLADKLKAQEKQT